MSTQKDIFDFLSETKTDNSEDVLKSKLQDSLDVADVVPHTAINYLEDKGYIKQDDKGRWFDLKEKKNIIKEVKERNDLIGKQVVIISDNDNYDEYRGINLEITHAEVGGRGYDKTMYPEALCSFVVVDSGEDVPYSLYEYEFEIID